MLIECKLNVSNTFESFFKQSCFVVCMVLCCVRVMAGKHVDLNAMDNYLGHKKCPDHTSTKGNKANFRRACKIFNLVSDQMMHKGNSLIIIGEQHHDAHQGLGDNVKADGLSSHLGRTSRLKK